MNFEPARERVTKLCMPKFCNRSIPSSSNSARLRLQAVSTGLPAALWAVVLIGAMLNGLLTYLFWIEQPQAPRPGSYDSGGLLHRGS